MWSDSRSRLAGIPVVHGCRPKRGPGGLESFELLEGRRASVGPCLSLFLEKRWGWGRQGRLVLPWLLSHPGRLPSAPEALVTFPSPAQHETGSAQMHRMGTDLARGMWGRASGTISGKTLGFRGCLSASNIASSQLLSSSFLPFLALILKRELYIL